MFDSERLLHPPHSQFATQVVRECRQQEHISVKLQLLGSAPKSRHILKGLIWVLKMNSHCNEVSSCLISNKRQEYEMQRIYNNLKGPKCCADLGTDQGHTRDFAP